MGLLEESIPKPRWILGYICLPSAIIRGIEHIGLCTKQDVNVQIFLLSSTKLALSKTMETIFLLKTFLFIKILSY